jgi:hypothetical protein
MQGHVCFVRPNGKIFCPHFGGKILRMRQHSLLHSHRTTAPLPLWWMVMVPCWDVTALPLPNSILCVGLMGSHMETCRNWTVRGHVGKVGSVHIVWFFPFLFPSSFLLLRHPWEHSVLFTLIILYPLKLISYLVLFHITSASYFDHFSSSTIVFCFKGMQFYIQCLIRALNYCFHMLCMCLKNTINLWFVIIKFPFHLNIPKRLFFFQMSGCSSRETVQTVNILWKYFRGFF